VKLSIVIPAFNEAANIAAAIREVQAAISDVPGIADHEIVVVDDCSTDHTFDTVHGLASPRVRCLRLSRQSGSHVAIRAGLDHAEGDAVLCLSADGQDDPGILKAMMQKWEAGDRVVWALRRFREEGISYRLLTGTFYLLLRLLTDKNPQQIDLADADFFLLDRKVVKSITSCPERNTSIFGLISWVGFRQGIIRYDRRPRMGGSSKWSFRSRLRLTVDWIVAFSGLPLRLISLLGLVVAMIGFLYAGVIVVNAYVGKPVAGWSETIILILTMGGLQMLISGIIGEYLWRNLEETRNRPLYFIEKQTDQNR